MNKGSFIVSIRTRRANGISERLKDFKGVVSVQPISPLHFKVQLQEQEELIEQIASEVIKSGAGLLELMPSKASLEDVFLKLTYGQDQ